MSNPIDPLVSFQCKSVKQSYRDSYMFGYRGDKNREDVAVLNKAAYSQGRDDRAYEDIMEGTF